MVGRKTSVVEGGRYHGGDGIYKRAEDEKRYCFLPEDCKGDGVRVTWWVPKERAVRDVSGDRINMQFGGRWTATVDGKHAALINQI